MVYSDAAGAEQVPPNMAFPSPWLDRLPETQVTLLSSMRLLVPSGLLPDELMEVLLGDLLVGRGCWDNTGRLRGAQLDLCLGNRWESECHWCLHHPRPSGPLQPHEGWALLGNYRHIRPNAEASAAALLLGFLHHLEQTGLQDCSSCSHLLFTCCLFTQQHVPPSALVDILFSRIRNNKITTHNLCSGAGMSATTKAKQSPQLKHFYCVSTNMCPTASSTRLTMRSVRCKTGSWPELWKEKNGKTTLCHHLMMLQWTGDTTAETPGDKEREQEMTHVTEDVRKWSDDYSKNVHIKPPATWQLFHTLCLMVLFLFFPPLWSTELKNPGKMGGIWINFQRSE